MLLKNRQNNDRMIDPHLALRKEVLSRYETFSGKMRTDDDVKNVFSVNANTLEKGLSKLDALEAIANGMTVEKAVTISGIKRAGFYKFKKAWADNPSIKLLVPYHGRPEGTLSTKPDSLRAQRLAADLDAKQPSDPPGKLATKVAKETDIHPLVCLSYVRLARAERTGETVKLDDKYSYRTNQKASSMAAAIEKANPLLSLRQVAHMVLAETNHAVSEPTAYNYAKKAREERTGEKNA